MKIIESVEVTDYVLYPHALLPLDVKGITTIRGKNLDSSSKLTSNKADTNAVGKTLLVSALSELAFASTPVTQDIKVQARKKDAFSSPTTSIKVRMYDSNLPSEKFEFEKKSKGASYEYIIRKNGKNTKIRSKKYPEEKIRSYFGMSEDEFYTLYMISAGANNKLRVGSATERLAFFTNLFRLNSYDDVRKLFNKLLSDSKDAKTALKEIDTQLEDLSTSSKDEIAELKEKLGLLKEKAAVCSKTFSDLHEKEVKFSFYFNMKDSFEKWDNLCAKLRHSYNSVNDINSINKIAERVISDAKAHEKSIVNQAAYEQNVADYSGKKKLLKEKMVSYKPKSGKEPEDFETENKKLSYLITSLTEKLEKANLNKSDLVSRLKEINFDKSKYTVCKETASILNKEELASKYSRAKANKEQAAETIVELEKISAKKECPTCKQPINKKLAKNLIKQLSSSTTEYDEIISNNKAKLKSIQEFELVSEAKEKYVKLTSSIEEEADNIACLKRDYTTAKEEITELEKWKKFCKYKKAYDDLEAPAKVSVTNFEFSKEQISLYKEIVSLGKIIESSYEKYVDSIDIGKSYKDKDLDRFKKEKKIAEKKLTQYNDKIPDLTSKLELAKRSFESYSKLMSRRKQISKKADDNEILEMLVEAYSNKGLKLLLIKQIASIIERNMNKYSSLIYPEPVKFKFSVENDRNFNITREMKIRGSVNIKDVRTLSGAESRAFSFLLPLSILPLIPHDRRLNVMILDEPIVNMGENRIELFVKSFIPKLATIVPHIVILTTHEEHYSNSIVYQVVKEKGVSRLEKVKT